jgi:DnaJ-class molecular chaperone
MKEYCESCQGTGLTWEKVENTDKALPCKYCGGKGEI